MRTLLFAYAKTKALIICAVTAQLISSIYSIIPQNFKPLADFCGCTSRFLSDLFGKNPKTGFVVTKLILLITLTCFITIQYNCCFVLSVSVRMALYCRCCQRYITGPNSSSDYKDYQMLINTHIMFHRNFRTGISIAVGFVLSVSVCMGLYCCCCQRRPEIGDGIKLMWVRRSFGKERKCCTSP